MGKIKYNATPIESSDDYSRTLYVSKKIKVENEIFFHDGTALILEPNVIHNEVYISSTTDLISIGFSLDDKERLVGKYSQTNDETNFIKNNIINIENELKTKEFNYVSNIEAYISLINNFIMRHNEGHHQTNDSFDMEFIVNYLNESYRTEIDVNVLSNMIGYCPDHFRVLFKNKTGLTPKQYIIKKRMEYADYLIRNTKLNLREIAIECGYEDYFQFSTYFKKYYNESPRDIRKEQQIL